MPRSDRPRLWTPLRVSFLLHAVLIGVLVYLIPEPELPAPRESMTFRFVGDVDPEPDMLEPVAAPEPEPVDTLDLPDFDVLLPPLLVEDELPPLEERPDVREPPPTLPTIPEGATRKPAPPPVEVRPRRPAARPAAPRAAPTAARRLPRVVRRPGTLRGFYPRDAQAAGIEGKALVLVRVDRRGQVADVRIHTSTGHGSLDAAALRVARLYEFAPGRPGRVLLPVPFRLD